VLFAFPSRYWFTIGRQRVFSLGEWSPQIPTRLHVSRGTQDAASSPVHFPLRGSHTLWLRFPADSRNVRFGNSTYAVLQPPNASTWVWAVPISLAATFGISVIYFPPGTEMVHFPGLAHTRLCIQRAVTRVHLAGFPHSEILGSKPACGSPRLIAACHVLLRLLAPRHPPYALSSLIIKLTQSVFWFLNLPIPLRRFDSRSSIHPRIPDPLNPPGFSRSAIQGFRLYAPQTIGKSAFSSTVMLNSSKTCNRPQ
jgi:hypothetical protein